MSVASAPIRARAVLAFTAICLLEACLEQGKLEQPRYSAHLLPASAGVPLAASDMLIAGKIAASIGAEGPEIPLHTGFAHGRDVHYWDLGEGQSSVEPIWIFGRAEDAQDAGEGSSIDHPPLVDSLPGDDAYSPFRAVYWVAVTARYRGERITSLAALDDAIEIGLVEEPVAAGTFVNWPIVPEDFFLASSHGDNVDTKTLYCRGLLASYLPVDRLEHARELQGSLPAPTAYQLRRQNETDTLEEPSAMLDLNGDGDDLDSNVIFSLDASESGYSGLWSVVSVTVRPDYLFGAHQDELDLFAQGDAGLEVIDDAFIERESSDELLNRPLEEVPP